MKSIWKVLVIPIAVWVALKTGTLVTALSNMERARLFDHNLWRLDLMLFGAPVAQMFSRWVSGHFAAFALLEGIYGSLHGMVAVMFMLSLLHPAKLPVGRALWFMFGTGFLGGLAYMLCPATGPVFVFGYTDPAAVPFGTIPPIADRAINATPSLHMTWALLVFSASRGFGKWPRQVTAGFALGTALATVGLGEHYIADLIVAVPFTFLVISLNERKWNKAALAAVIVVAWQLSVRWLPTTENCFLVLIPLSVWCGVQMLWGSRIHSTAHARIQPTNQPAGPRSAHRATSSAARSNRESQLRPFRADR